MTTPAVTPTTNHDPADCHVCGRHATGIGIGFQGRDPNPRWLCTECALILEHIRNVKRMDPYELRARAGGMEAAAPLIDEFGSDLSEWTEEQAMRLCGAIWKGCADELRRLIMDGEAPF